MPVTLDQICPAAGTGTDGDGLVLQGRLGLVAGWLLHKIYIRRCCATMILNIGCIVLYKGHFFDKKRKKSKSVNGVFDGV